MNLYGFGNHKLSAEIATLNLGGSAIDDCPQGGTCPIRGVCYACADEALRPGVRAARRRVRAFWAEASAEEMVGVFVGERGARPVRYLRVNVASDFHDQGEVDKLARMARLLKGLGVKVYGYTRRADLDFSRLRRVATINGAGFMLSNRYNTIDADTFFSLPSGWTRCPGKCGLGLCERCMESRGLTVWAPLRVRTWKKRKEN